MTPAAAHEAPVGGMRRIVTGHNDEGLAVIAKDDEIERVDVTSEGVTFAVLWSTDKWPINNQTPEDGARKPVFSGNAYNENGSVVRFVDMPPGSFSLMHRTQTLDYGIVIFGQVDLELDSGEKTTLKPGDTCIQRGTNHVWRNTTEQWTRIAFILLHSRPIAFDGQKLVDHGFPGQD
ncbi:related to Cupin domain protein [Melanopsichium pennsylvanicum]|uniref:Related to Cupin domain protein n=2 Tax=Melanopsichium pennsylvanicum TaxID=63383 RepID=A0AAJ4XHH6_9BASI|nr:cupin 2 conserved barrel domain protein [Melanopsichium pennsylvanicum 4]SNX82167.1 related to Cupin domain protein [Melanopsichium pennsylvanicum]